MKVATKIQYAAITFLLALIAGCASMPMAPPEQDSQAKRFEVPPDRARIYLYRNEVLGAAIPLSVSFDGQLAGQTGSRTFFVWEVSPGPHQLVSLAENVSSLIIDAESGKNYFVWQEMKMGLFMARTQLQQVDVATGQAAVRECRLLAMKSGGSLRPDVSATTQQDKNKRALEDLRDLLPQKKNPAQGLQDLRDILPSQ